MKKKLQAFASLVLAIVYVVTSISPIQLRAAEKLSDLQIDFSEVADAELFSTTYGGWGISEGVYKANTEWANTYLTDAISLATDKEISFDFCLVDDNDENHQFNIGLVNVSDGAFSGGVSTHFYYSSQYAVELVTLNGTYGNTYDGWIADTVVDYFDGQNHTMAISIVDKTASFKIDGNEVLKSAEVGLDAIYLVFQSTSTEYAIDNILIESEAPEYRNLEVDFDVNEDGNVFATTYGGWSISEGVYKANTAWATTYLNGLIPLDDDKEISFDFCLVDDNDENHQFNVGLVNKEGASFSGGISTHFYYSSQYAVELVTLNSVFGNTYDGWIADTVVDCFDGQTHTMTIKIENKMATIQIDGTNILTNQEVGLDSVYLIFQATNTAYTVDNIKIKTPDDVPTYQDLDIDFEDATGGDVFTSSYLGWNVANGVYQANGEFANTYLKTAIPFDTDKVISFDFTLKNDGATDHQFNVGLVNIEGTTVSGGVTAHFYFSNQWGMEMGTLNTEFASPTGGTWIADTINNYFDGQKHNMIIAVAEKTATFKVDGKEIFASAAVGLDSAHLMLQATNTAYTIDNLKVKTVSGEPELPTVIPYQEVNLDFEELEDGKTFSTTYAGWTVTGGVYKPNAAWANTYPSFKIPLNEDKQISFDFCMNNKGDKNHQFNFGFVDIQGDKYVTDVAAHFYNSSQWNMELFTLNQDMGNPIGEGWIADCTDNYNDGQKHNMLIAVRDGKASFYIDGKMIFKQIPLKTSESYFIMQYTSMESYIDNFKISNTLTVNPDKDEAKVPTQTDTQGKKEPYAYREMTLNFFDKKDGDAFATLYEGWEVVKGVYKAKTAWASTYLNCKIPLNSEKEITFDFCMKNNGDKNHQFNIGFVDIQGDKATAGLVGHFYQHAQYGELFTLNRDFGNPIGEGWIADCMTDFNDGKVHSMMIRVKDAEVAFYIDGNVIFEKIELDMKSAYFIMQFTSVDSYIDNFRISSKLTYIPDYPVNTPDPTGDVTTKARTMNTELVTPNGKIVQRTDAKAEGLSPIMLVAIIVGSVVGVATVAGGVIMFVKKRRLGTKHE